MCEVAFITTAVASLEKKEFHFRDQGMKTWIFFIQQVCYAVLCLYLSYLVKANN